MQVGFSAVGIDSGMIFSEIDLGSKVKAIKSWSKNELYFRNGLTMMRKLELLYQFLKLNTCLKKFNYHSSQHARTHKQEEEKEEE